MTSRVERGHARVWARRRRRRESGRGQYRRGGHESLATRFFARQERVTSLKKTHRLLSFSERFRSPLLRLGLVLYTQESMIHIYANHGTGKSIEARFEPFPGTGGVNFLVILNLVYHIPLCVLQFAFVNNIIS